MRLIDCFIKVLAYTSYVVSTCDKGQVPYNEARSNICRFLAESEKMAERHDFTRGEYQEARFAIYVWIDEAILCSDWECRDCWRSELLQTAYGTTNGGAEFYQRLESLTAEMNQVREVYYHCLSLGFKGRYYDPAYDEHLEKIKRRCFATIRGESPMLAMNQMIHFFSEAYPLTPPPHRRKVPIALSYATVAMIILPIIFISLTYISYDKSLDYLVERLVRQELK